MSLNSNHQNLIKYWDLTSIKTTLQYISEEEYIEEFSSILSQAVESRIAKGQKNSILLSGGLDSTSIYALAKNIEKKETEIKGFSAVFDELEECDERYYINILMDLYDDKTNSLNFDNILMFDDFPYSVPFTFEPHVNTITFNFTFNIVLEAAKKGFNNILSGYAGDHLLTGSLYVANDLLKRGRIKEVFSYVTNYSIGSNTSALNNFLKFALLPNVLNDSIQIKNSNYYFEIKRKMKEIKHYHQKQMYFQISNAKTHLYTDRVIGSLTKSSLHHPFLDRRLIEFVYKIPGNLKLKDGQTTKYILRKSMEPYLPKEIIHRRNKTTHLVYTYKGIRKNWDLIYRSIGDPYIVNELNLVSREVWNEELIKWRNGVETREDFWTLFAMEVWFIQYKNKSKNALSIT
ncbi:asparagine synthase C-terminal domain-containing protein [Lysinibacillus sp. FSL H8-0500]|uniref:asparagine synthase-related protein n=1 Tax=Lysinibacillus TaxID=400634 RepID=UPI0006B42DCB|nr:asparagine synthase C-terminal domain-containing protein [Lysinibacillus macroides]QPR69110.1 asparagine synthase [Lysinibacillus macroides]